MTTAQTTRKSAKDATAPVAAFTDYLETLTERHEKLTVSLKDSRDRARRITEELSDALLAGQRDMLVAVRQFASNPTDMSANAKAMMEVASAAQERSLNLGKLVYTEQAQAGAEMRKFWEATMAIPSTLMPTMPSLGKWFAKAE